MAITIGYIGSEHSVKTVKTIARQHPTIQVRTYLYGKPSEISKLHRQAAKETDIICFSGIVSFYYRDRNCENKPFIITPFHEYMIAASILTCLINFNARISELSIDLPDRSILLDIQNDITFQLNPLHVYDYQWIYNDSQEKKLSIQEITAFHETLYIEKQTKMAITSIHYVYDLLKKRNVPVIYMVDTERNIEEILYEASKRVLFSQLQDGMLSILYISLKDKTPLTLKQFEIIMNTIKPLPGIEYSIKRKDKLICYTTRGTIEDFLLTRSNLEWITQLESDLEQSFAFGVGYGKQLFEAEENALLALQTAINGMGSNGYVVTDNKELIGPVFGETRREKIRTTDQWLHHVINKTNTNLRTMQRFFTFLKVHQFGFFSVRELAIFSQVSIRTSERFVKRLYEAGLVEIIGQEQGLKKGRPRNVYKVSEELEIEIRKRV
ncbi:MULTISPECIES: hypothetical protein [Virgibacillus]|uniref:hypothetical protein n=1 Tax=Virgibacillus TaxID=84406 RepID=UPI000EF555CF|nr:hypothetical protein [Virgibacillus sp. Bac332]